MSNNNFSNFNFSELLEIVKTIRITKRKSSDDIWKKGYGLQSIDTLEANVDNILNELATRIRRNWSLRRIQHNFQHSKINLPNEILNLFNMTSAELNKKLFKHQLTVGSDISEDGVDEIWFIVRGNKYKMKKDGIIDVRNI